MARPGRGGPGAVPRLGSSHPPPPDPPLSSTSLLCSDSAHSLTKPVLKTPMSGEGISSCDLSSFSLETGNGDTA